jgi:hypothetical protein
MPADHAMLLEEIAALLASEPAAAALPAIEDTLTAGYARAMALEAERWRLQRQLGEVAGQVEDDVEAHVLELARLARCVTKTDGDLGRLRALLGSLRDRARELRTAALS